MSDTAIALHGIDKQYDDIKALDGVTFDVPVHSVFGLLGPNGAGKTTLFSIIADFLKADAGRIELLGTNHQHISELRGRMTILPQDAQFQRSVPILEQLVLFRLLDGCNRKDAERQVEATLAKVGLEDYAKRGARVLSHGMAKRLGIAQAFLGEPELILLDEPTAGLDPANARQIRDLIKELRGKATVVISSHNLDEIQQLCSDIAILNKGKVVTAGSVAELTRTDLGIDIDFARDLTAEEIEAIEALPGVRTCASTGPRQYVIGLVLDDGESGTWEEVVSRLLRSLLDRGLVPRGMREGRSLENHFLQVTEGNAPEA